MANIYTELKGLVGRHEHKSTDQPDRPGNFKARSGKAAGG